MGCDEGGCVAKEGEKEGVGVVVGCVGKEGGYVDGVGVGKEG